MKFLGSDYELSLIFHKFDFFRGYNFNVMCRLDASKIIEDRISDASTAKVSN